MRKETNPDDLEGMIAATGILTSRGGKTSHAAVVARGMGKTASAAPSRCDVDAEPRAWPTAGGVMVREGDVLSIDGSTGEVFLGELPVVAVAGGDATSRRGSTRRWPRCDEETAELIRAVDRLLTHADSVRRLRGARQRRHRRRRRARPAHGRPGHRAVPHRAHVPRRPPRAHRAGRSWPTTRRSGTRRWSAAAAADAQDFVELLDGDGRAARRRSGCSTRRCTSSCPTAPS